MPSTIYYPSYNKPELKLEFGRGLENLPLSQPGRNNQSRMETPGGAAIVQELGPRVQFLRWNIKNLDVADKIILYNFFNDTANWGLYSFDYQDVNGKLFHGCRFWQPEDDFREQDYKELYGENIVIRVNTIQHIYTGSSPDARITRSITGFGGSAGWFDVEDLAEAHIWDLAVFKGWFYATTGNSGNIYKSKDGDTWIVAFASSQTAAFGMQVFGGDLYVGTGSNGKIFRTTDGITWNEVYDDGTEIQFPILGVFGGQIYAGSTTNGKIKRSPTGASGSWSEVYASGQTAILGLIEYKGYFYASSSVDGKIFRSLTGNPGSWSEVYAPAGATQIKAMAIINDTLIVGVNAGTNKIHSTTDGASGTWSAGATISEVILRTLAVYGEYAYLATGTDGKMYRAHKDDLATWSVVFNSTDDDLESIGVFTF